MNKFQRIKEIVFGVALIALTVALQLIRQKRDERKAAKT